MKICFVSWKELILEGEAEQQRADFFTADQIKIFQGIVSIIF